MTLGDKENPLGEDLIDMQEIANMSGLTYETIRNYKYWGRIPEPEAVIGRSPFWRREVILEWMGDETEGGGDERD